MRCTSGKHPSQPLILYILGLGVAFGQVLGIVVTLARANFRTVHISCYDVLYYILFPPSRYLACSLNFRPTCNRAV